MVDLGAARLAAALVEMQASVSAVCHVLRVMLEAQEGRYEEQKYTYYGYDGQGELQLDYSFTAPFLRACGQGAMIFRRFLSQFCRCVFPN